MSTWQQTQMPNISGSAPPPPGFYPQGGAPYPKADGGYVPSRGYSTGGSYPSGGGSPTGGGYPPHNFDFSDQTIRKNFISKVYSILMCQLLVTTIFIAFTTFHEPTNNFMKGNILILIPAVVISFGVIIALACVENLRRKSPTNFILLFIFTIAESITVAMGTILYPSDKVLIAFGLTTLLCFALTIFAFHTKIDFTVMGGFLIVFLIILCVVSLVALFFPSKLMTLLIASAGALIFSLYLIYDTQLMVGGEHKYSISPEEYIFAAINIYLDIINIFMHILAILGGSSDN